MRGHVLFHDHESMKGFPWEKLCESSTVDFFTKFPRYIQIEIKARTPEDHRIWYVSDKSYPSTACANACLTL